MQTWYTPYQESVLDAAVGSRVGDTPRPRQPVSFQTDSGTVITIWMHLLWAYPDFEGFDARINGDRLQMVVFGGSISSLDTEGIMNSFDLL